MTLEARRLKDAGHLQEAEQLVNRALALLASVKRAGPIYSTAAQTVLAAIYMDEGRFADAEQLLKYVLSVMESVRGPNEPGTIYPLMTLVDLYVREGRVGDAESPALRAVAVAQRRYGANGIETAEPLNTVGLVYQHLGKFDQAANFYSQALALYQNNPQSKYAYEIADEYGNLGTVYFDKGDYQEALRNYAAAFQIKMQKFGPEDPSTVKTLSNAAICYEKLNQFDPAAEMMSRVLAYSEKNYGPDSVLTAHDESISGWVEIGRKDYAKALGFFRPSLSTYLTHRRVQKAAATNAGGVDEREVARNILGLLKSLWATAQTDPSNKSLVEEAFIAAQQVHRGKAETALALTTARLSAGDGALAQLVRQQQDLAAQRDALDAALTKALSQPPTTRNPAAEAQARRILAQDDASLKTIDATIRDQFPRYATMADPEPLSIQDVQRLLHPDEAMVAVAPFGGANGEGTFVFVITTTEARWNATEVGTTGLTSQILKLLCGLNVEGWQATEGGSFCQRFTGSEAPGAGQPLPFDAGVAFETFQTLFGDLAPMLQGKSLLIAAPDPLSSLPFGVLVTERPDGSKPQAGDYHRLAWLGRSNPISVLPSVVTLQGLRGHAQIASAPLPYIGFGDPLLVGSRSCPRDDAVSQSCPDEGAAAPLRAALVSRGATRLDAVGHSTDGQADLDAVRALCPLPETATELRCVAKSLHVPDSMVHTGQDATTKLVETTDLSQYRIIHFATHGLLAGEMAAGAGSVAEPALVLTPPAAETRGDDGLLRASAVASLKLNADWVVLSACNTAAGSSLGGEAMSGLASAFFYAGARALLVSHWPVRSDAAVLLTTAAFAALQADPSIGRAEALRRSARALMDNADTDLNHPAVWAPFSVVGEGGALH